MFELIVSPTEQGLRALDWLQRRIPQAPSAYLRQLLRSGRIRRQGAVLGEHDPLQADDMISLPESGRLRELLAAPAAVTVTILLETEHLLAVAKPSGLAVHGSYGHELDNLTLRVQTLMRERGCRFQIAPLHRLDLETSGPVLFGKGHAAIARYGRLFMSGAIGKEYLALAAGELGSDGWLESPVPAKGKLKEARTHYRTLASAAGFSLLLLAPETGRQHQLRRQLADAGHPIAGDRRYGGPQLAELSRLFLHCRRLVLPDPDNRQTIVIDAPLPATLAAVLRQRHLPFGE